MAAPAAPPPAAPAKPAAPAGNVGSVTPSSKGEIHVTTAGMSNQTPVEQPKPAAPAQPSAKDKMFERMGAKIKPGTGVDPFPEKPTVPDAPKPDLPRKSEIETAEVVDDQPEPPDPKAKTGDAKDKKVNPWKLVDEHKTARAKLETELVELKKLVPNEAARKKEVAELEQYRKRAQELEDEIRFVNYEKSPEFQDKYQKPYKEAWTKAMNELRELTIEQEDGTHRQVSPNDLLRLVNAPLGQAREMAETMFGAFANDVMVHRKEIKNLFDKQSSALEEARTKGAERERTMLESYQNMTQTMQKTVSGHWQKAQEAALADANIGKYLKPIEGNEEHNTRLTKAQELIDQAFKENPLDPRLTEEQREAIVKRHAALRNRAIAYGPLMNENKTLQARVSELEEKLKQYQGSTPETTGTQPRNGDTTPANPRDAMWGRLGKLAKNPR